MYNKPTLNHHHQTALLYLYNNPNQPAFTGPNNQALNELRQMGYVKAKKFENWAGTGSCKFEWYLTKAGIERVEVGILGKCTTCNGSGQTLLRGKCTTCNGSGQVWINEWMQKPIEDNPQIIPKFEKTDANRLADAIEEIARLEKALEESEKRGAELAASYCDGVVGDEHGHAYCRYKVERDAALAEVNRLRESKGDPSGSFDRCVKMMYERDENAKRLDAALARIAELETALAPFAAVAQPQPCTQPQAHPARCGCER
ncbi:chaperone protein DnaJ [Pseudomonas phage NP3]|uniref:Chaperone protein DnaJ n=1 Tax=Pseudomonas phage NP3 TaxID=1775428 RepID=A0A142FGI0_9CAUD|nr:chaperone protein DnaJ [Pseudomonas phage NP3]